MEQAPTPDAPTEVPAGFVVRAPLWLPVVIATFAILNLATVIVEPGTVGVVLALGLTFAAVAQRSWSAEVGPDGIRFSNRVGVDWDRPWADLRPDVQVRRPGRFGALVHGRLRTGRRVNVPNGVVTAIGGATVAPETAQQLMQACADAGTAQAGTAD